MPMGTAVESSGSSGTAWRICRLVTSVVSAGLRPTETPFWLYGLSGMRIGATPRVKLAGGLFTSSGRVPGHAVLVRGELPRIAVFEDPGRVVHLSDPAGEAREPDEPPLRVRVHGAVQEVAVDEPDGGTAGCRGDVAEQDE